MKKGHGQHANGSIPLERAVPKPPPIQVEREVDKEGSPHQNEQAKGHQKSESNSFSVSSQGFFIGPSMGRRSWGAPVWPPWSRSWSDVDITGVVLWHLWFLLCLGIRRVRHPSKLGRCRCIHIVF